MVKRRSVPDTFQPLFVYLDANVLFSASWSEQNRFLKFWRLREITPVTSPYVVDEVDRNIRKAEHRLRFDMLMEKTTMVSDGPLQIVPEDIVLVPKDRPILASAIFASMDYLVTGDTNHFGHLHNTTVSHVKILSPGDFLDRYEYRLKF